MPYGVVTTLSAPLEVYDQIHSHVMNQTPMAIDGLLVHIGRPSPTGFEVVEVWESRAKFENYQRELLVSMTGGPGGGMSSSMPAPTIEEFEVRGLVVPHGNIAF